MISIHIHVRERGDLRKLLWVLEGYNEVAKYNYLNWTVWEEWDRRKIFQHDDFLDYYEMKRCDLLVVELSDAEDITYLKMIREYYLQAELILLTDDTISAQEYLNPEIHPILFLRRLFHEDFEDCLTREFDRIIRYLLKKRESECFTHRFLLQPGYTEYVIPYSSIYYFEACNKKIIMHYKWGQHEFYDTMSKLERVLPGIFIRCHRGYIINSIYIRRKDIGFNSVVLDNGDVIPISKNYRKTLEKAWGRCTEEDVWLEE